MAPRRAPSELPRKRGGLASRRRLFATGDQYGCDQQLCRALRAQPRRRAVDRGLPRRVQAQPACLRHRRRADAQGHRRADDGRYAQRRQALAPVRQQGHQDLSRLRRVLRHGGRDRAGRQLLPPRRPGAGGEEADPLPARPGRRRQELDRRAAQAADGARAVLHDQGLAGERVAARPVRSDRGRPAARERVRHPAPLPQPDPQPVGGEATRRVRRRHPQVQDRQAPSERAQADRRLQDRAGRREQPGHLGAGRQGRHPEARDLLPGRSGRLQLLRRPVPGQPGPARVRGDVQGADQGAAPAAHGHPGRQLQGHRGLRRDSRSTASSSRTATRASGRPSATTRTTRPSSTGSTSSRSRTACAPPRRSRSTRSCCATRRWPTPSAPRARSR